MGCMAQSLETEVITSEHKPKDNILSHLYSEAPCIIAFSVFEGFEDLTQLEFLQNISGRVECF